MTADHLSNHLWRRAVPWIVSFICMWTMATQAAELQDVVYLKNGGVVRGIIVEQVPGEKLTIETVDGNRFVYQMEEVQRIAKEPQRGSRRRQESATESWYTIWGLGLTSASYGDELDGLMDFYGGSPGVDRTTISLDMLGVYFPAGNGNALVGGIINGFGDRIDYGGEWFQINGVTYGGSAIYFPQGTIGKGPFFRVDAGPSRMTIDSSDMGDEASDWGFGGLLGTGVAYPVTSGTRISLTVSYAFRRIEGDDIGAWSAVLSGIF